MRRRMAGSGVEASGERWWSGGEVAEEGVLLALHGFGFGEGDALELDEVAGFELAQLPEFGLDDGGGADEAAEGGAVGAEEDGHVAGEVDGADGVGVVVDVGGVEAGFAAVGARPFWLGADEADAGAIALVVDLPLRGEEHVDVFFGEELGRGVRAEEDADGPVMGEGGDVAGGKGCGGFEGEVVLAEVEDVSGAKGSASVSAKAAEDEGAAAAEEGLRVEAAAYGEVGADAFFGGGAEREDAAGFDFDGLPAGYELAVQLGGHVCAG